jgi:hypothetical protein
LSGRDLPPEPAAAAPVAPATPLIDTTQSPDVGPKPSALSARLAREVDVMPEPEPAKPAPAPAVAAPAPAPSSSARTSRGRTRQTSACANTRASSSARTSRGRTRQTSARANTRASSSACGQTRCT